MKWRSPFVATNVIVLATPDVDLTWLQMERAQLFAKAEAASMCGMNWDNKTGQVKLGGKKAREGNGPLGYSLLFSLKPTCKGHPPK